MSLPTVPATWHTWHFLHFDSWQLRFFFRPPSLCPTLFLHSLPPTTFIKSPRFRLGQPCAFVVVVCIVNIQMLPMLEKKKERKKEKRKKERNHNSQRKHALTQECTMLCAWEGSSHFSKFSYRKQASKFQHTYQRFFFLPFFSLYKPHTILQCPSFCPPSQ